MSTLIIGFSGRARHGKTIASEAIQHYVTGIGRTAQIYDIGGMILRHCILNGLLPVGTVRAQMTRDQLQVLIDVGKQMRETESNYWVNRLLSEIEADQPDVALCPNLRLPQEADAFRAKGGYIIRCTRLNENGSLFISEDRPPNDITETALEFWPADFYLTMKQGHPKLVEAQAICIYDYLRRNQ